MATKKKAVKKKTAKKAVKKKTAKKAVKKKTAKKATRVAQGGVIAVGKFDGETQDIHVRAGQTVEEAFEEAGYNLNNYTDLEINTLNADTVRPKDKVRPGTTYLLTGNYENGM